uniref:Uncharacterized protein n=1 Tax=Octopus bimaculoides TaxID=37653 RepID=A0A0L8H412_OCTBM
MFSLLSLEKHQISLNILDSFLLKIILFQFFCRLPLKYILSRDICIESDIFYNFCFL